MAATTLSISGGTPPFKVTITEAASGNQIPCSSGCGSSNDRSRNIVFSALTGTYNYRMRIEDSSSPVCVSEQLTGALTCQSGSTVSFTANVIQPTCSGSTLSSSATVQLSNIANGNRYHIYQNNSISGNDCGGAISFTGSSVSIPVNAPAQGQSQPYAIRIWGGSDCSSYADAIVTVNSPTCQPGSSCNLTISLGTPTCS
ncbi:hypothetical protein CLV58_109170 [Spirosoma oryzae]|uniref:Uncharacterized protein n=1 Tax=Spirosoma oryzae TaxID=1469603 RepID=A0A2T0SYK6_9BACT|nr:hypothetical protein [Spirosoma oryzae]PRY38443.1 hypothetical protein CLV58_109170 [Spirosoma oryzae]